MQRLRDMISKIYLSIDSTKDTSRETIQKLEQIEYKILQFIEERTYIINHGDSTKAQEVLDREKKLDMQRRNAKIEKMKKMEKDAILE